MNIWNCPIVICAYNRPDYLERCLDYLFKTPDIAESRVPVYVFCDGGSGSKQKENADLISHYPLVTKVFYQTENLCIAKHIFLIRETVFDKMGFPRMMFLEEDILVSPYYYRFINRVLDGYQTVIDPTVVMVNSSVICLETVSQKIFKQRDFSDCLSHLNNYVVLRSTWDVIKPIMQEYLDRFIISSPSYRELPHDKVMEWATNKIKSSDSPQAKNERTLRHLTSSQDSITNMAMRINNLRYVSSYVNRVLNVGRVGYHYEPEYFNKHGMDKMMLDVLSKDAEEVDTILDMDVRKEYIL